MGAEHVRERRREERRSLVARAREFAAGLDPTLGIRAAVVIGSVARGDFNVWSDVDIVIVADAFASIAEPLRRLEALGPRPALVQPIAWSRADWDRALVRRNPMAVEAVGHGVWLVGSAASLDEQH